MNRRTVLVVDDDQSLRRVMEMQLEEMGCEVITAASGPEALEILSSRAVTVVLTDLKMPGMSGLDLLRRVRKEHPGVLILVITAYGTVETAVAAMREGAYDYLTKPLDYHQLAIVVNRALERQNLVEEVRHLRTTLDRKYGFESITGNSPKLLRVLDLASRAAQSDSTVLIRGETGTGKELLAKAVHRNSRRKDKPFVTINCGAIPKDLLESELFGYRKGSFTGAAANKPGKAEMADQGTLFLDEIGELPLELQVKLLRLIQEGQIDKVGATEAVGIDVRIIAATHRNLQAMIDDGAFRQDLYYRLAVITLELPPLRERVDDIPQLAQELFVKIKAKQHREELRLSPSLLPHFCGYSWPGNVRELENVIERLVVLTPGEEVTRADLPEFLQAEQPALEALQFALPPQGISLEAVEKELILRALTKFDWNQTQAARYLDISRRTLIYRMEKHGIRKEGTEPVQETAG
jgi:two-component system NtrC family response regulator